MSHAVSIFIDVEVVDRIPFAILDTLPNQQVVRQPDINEDWLIRISCQHELAVRDPIRTVPVPARGVELEFNVRICLSAPEQHQKQAAGGSRVHGVSARLPDQATMSV